MAFQSDLLWQNDPKWANEKLGFGPQTIKEWGCLMTSLCMVTNGYGYKETPSSFNKKFPTSFYPYLFILLVKFTEYLIKLHEFD